MSTPQRATGKAAQKPIFQKPDDSGTTDADAASANDPDAFRVEESTTTLDASDEVPDDNPYERRLETLELDHEDTGDRLSALERLVVALCDSVYGKGVIPTLSAPEEGVMQ